MVGFLGPRIRTLVYAIALLGSTGGAGLVAYTIGHTTGKPESPRAALNIHVTNIYTVSNAGTLYLNGRSVENFTLGPAENRTFNESVAFAEPYGSYYEVKVVSAGVANATFVLVHGEGPYAVRLNLNGGPSAVALLPPVCCPTGPYQYRVEVGSVSRAVAQGQYQLVLLNASRTVVPPTDLAPGTLGSGEGVTLVFTDVYGLGTLDAGDNFVLQGVKGPYQYRLELRWKATSGLVTSASIP